MGQTNQEGWTWGKVWSVTKIYGGAVAVGAGMLDAATGSLGAAGFTATGIATKSLAAKAMAMSAVSNGGGVAAGGVVASLQSAGAAGLGLGTKIAIVTTSGGMYNYIFGSRTEKDVKSMKKQNEN